MCCLKYEQDHYEQTRKRMPRVGREIITSDGSGVINAINVLEETVRVRIAVGDSFELREYKIDDCQRPGQDERKPRPEEDATMEDAQQAAENAEDGAAETAELNPPKKQEQRPPRGERPERAPRPERGPKPERGPRLERGEMPPEAGERPETAEKAGGQAAGSIEAPVKAEQPVIEEQKAALGRSTCWKSARTRRKGRSFLKNHMHIKVTALAVKCLKAVFFIQMGNGAPRGAAEPLTHCGLRWRCAGLCPLLWIHIENRELKINLYL